MVSFDLVQIGSYGLSLTEKGREKKSVFLSDEKIDFPFIAYFRTLL